MKKTILIIASACAFIFGSSVLVSCDSASTTSNEETTEETTEEHTHAEGEEHGDMDMTTTTEETTEEHVHAEGEEHGEAKFACAMKCEGDKTYAEAGQCPKCGMDLAEMKAEESTTETEGETETQEN